MISIGLHYVVVVLLLLFCCNVAVFSCFVDVL